MRQTTTTNTQQTTQDAQKLIVVKKSFGYLVVLNLFFDLLGVFLHFLSGTAFLEGLSSFDSQGLFAAKL